MKFDFDFKAVAILVIVVVVSTFLLGYTNVITRDIIYENQVLKLNNQMKMFFEDMTDYRVLTFDGSDNDDGVYYEVLGSKEEVLGYVLLGKAMGYNDNIEVLVAVDADKEKIINVSVLSQLETPGIGTKIVTDKDFLRQFKDIDLEFVNDGEQIDGITGATVSSNAMILAIKKAVNKVD